MRFGTTNILQETVETINRGIDRYIIHPKYEPRKPYFDVGLAITFIPVEYTAYIRPVCLPTKPVDDDDDLEGDLVTLSGWGKQYIKDKRNYFPSNKIKLSALQVIHGKKSYLYLLAQLFALPLGQFQKTM